MALGGGHLGCLSLRVPIGVTSKAIGGGEHCSFFARHRAGSGHKPNSLENRAEVSRQAKAEMGILDRVL